METLRVGGVPEHFNLPWHLALEQNLFQKNGVNVEFVEQKLGTGAMLQNLKEGEVDIIVALTEGLVADICKGSDVRLVGTYVQSPLCWAISTGQNSPFNSVEDLKGQKWGISRYSSGSHLMTFVLAMERGWHPRTDLAFEVKGDFTSLRASVNDGSTAAFMWETFTTKPFHDKGEVRRIGEITTPWPCFMMASRLPILEQKLDAVKKMLSTINQSCKLFHEAKEEMPPIVAERYGLTLQDANLWYSNVDIVASSSVSEGALERAVKVLAHAKVLSSADVHLENLLYGELAHLQKDIKLVKLYNKPELLRGLRNNLSAAGLDHGSISYQDLIPYDQHHYHGTEALDWCIQELNLSAESNVVNIGSGLGGPARYFAGKLGCQVLAVELQDELHRAASELTERCGLRDKVHHMAGDFLQIGQHLKSEGYDAIVSWLTVLHIGNREKLFQLCYSILKPGGVFFAEDFFEKGALTAAEKKTLETEVFASYIPSMSTYKDQLEKAGFELVKVDDLTEDWTAFTQQRVEKFDAEKEQLIKVHREDTYNRLRYFYNVVRELYAGGNLGGARFIARKPLSS